MSQLHIDIGWVDIGMLLLVLLSMLVGLMRGVVFELLSLVGWFVAYFLARAATPLAVGYIHIGEPGSGLNYGATFACIFLLVVVLWSVAARLVRALIRATPLSPVDRLFGAGFGLLRGLVLLTIATLLVGMSPWAKTPAWQRSIGATWLNVLLHEVRPIFFEQDSQPLSA
jgi:membrane protein required for colicin V production